MTDNNPMSNTEMAIELIKLKQRMYELEKDMADLKPLTTEMVRHEEYYKQIISTLNEVKEDICDMKKSPWKYLDYVIMVIISTFIGFLFKHFGGN